MRHVDQDLLIAIVKATLPNAVGMFGDARGTGRFVADTVLEFERRINEHDTNHAPKLDERGRPIEGSSLADENKRLMAILEQIADTPSVGESLMEGIELARQEVGAAKARAAR